MLSVIRDNKKSVIGLIIAGFMAFLMIGFGMNARGAYKESREQTALRVGSHEVSVEQYYRQLEQLTEAYRNQLGANFGNLKNFLNLEQRAIDSLIEEFILKDFIDSLGLTASTAQVEGYIAQLPFFQKFGLTKETFNSFLNAQGMTGEGLEAKTREELGGLQFQSILADLSQPSEQELKAVFREQNTKYDFEYLTFRPEDFAPKVDTTQEDKLKEYFKEHTETYRKPRSVRFSFIKFDPADYLGKVELTEEDVRELYNAKQSQLFEPKQIKVRQIVLNKSKQKGSALEEMVTGKDTPPPADAANQAKKARAEEVVEKLKQGEDFAKLAAEYSEDPATKTKGGDRGWILPSELDKDVRSVADRVQKGKYSNVIETSEQYVVIFIDDIKERRAKAFEDVRPGLETELRQQDAPEYAHVEAERLYRRWQDDAANRNLSLADFAAKEKRSVEESGKLLASTENAANAPSLTAKIIAMSQGDRQTVRAGNTDYLVEILETKEAYVPELDQVRQQVIENYKMEKSRALAKEAAEKALAAISGKSSADAGAPPAEKKSISAVAKEVGLTTKTTGLISRAEPGKEPLLMQPEAKKELFALGENTPVVPRVLTGPTGEFVIAALKARVTPDDKEFETNLPTLRSEEKQTAHSRLGSFVYQSLRASADVWVNPKVLEGKTAQPSVSF